MNQKTFGVFKMALSAIMNNTKVFQPISYGECFHFLNYIERYQTSRGELRTIKHLKDLRLWVYGRVSGDVVTLSFVKTKNGIPMALGP
jgi:hypothetical protein